MKSLKEKSQEYAEEAFAKALKAPWPEAKQAFADAYLAGAADALSCQWRRPEDEKPKDGELVIVREYYRSAKNGRFVTHFKEFYYFEEYGFELEEKINRSLGYRITHWLPIPQCPKP